MKFRLAIFVAVVVAVVAILPTRTLTADADGATGLSAYAGEGKAVSATSDVPSLGAGTRTATDSEIATIFKEHDDVYATYVRGTKSSGGCEITMTIPNSAAAGREVAFNSKKCESLHLWWSGATSQSEILYIVAAIRSHFTYKTNSIAFAHAEMHGYRDASNSFIGRRWGDAYAFGYRINTSWTSRYVNTSGNNPYSTSAGSFGMEIYDATCGRVNLSVTPRAHVAIYPNGRTYRSISLGRSLYPCSHNNPSGHWTWNGDRMDRVVLGVASSR